MSVDFYYLTFCRTYTAKLHIMNNYLKSGLLAAALFSMPIVAFAQQHTVYFNQNGKLTATMPSVAYVRQYKIEAGKAQVQDFYYPSMKKYSDPYEVPAGQIKVFVPALDNGTLTCGISTVRKRWLAAIATASLMVSGSTGIQTAKNLR